MHSNAAISHAKETIVVVPCYNEARRLDVAAFDEFLARARRIAILLVDDGSTDDTPQVIERLRVRYPRQVMTLRLSANAGKAEAVRRGIQLALRRRPALVGFWDADLATPLGSILEFEAVLRDRPELQLVMGSRVALMGRQIRRRYSRHLLGRAFATAASFVLRLPVYDTQCGAKLFRVTPLVADLFQQPFKSRWIFDVEILARFLSASHGHRILPARDTIYEYPLEKWQDVQGSRLKPRDFATAALDLAAIGWRYRFPGATRPETAKGEREHSWSPDHGHRNASGSATRPSGNPPAELAAEVHYAA